MSISQVIDAFVTKGIQLGGWMEMDRVYLQNRLLGLIGEETFEKPVKQLENIATNELLDTLVNQAVMNKVIEDNVSAREILESSIADLLTPPPSVLNALFAQRYEKDPVDATDYFYEMSKANNYVKTKAIQKNRVFSVETEYGTLDITINLSKPEKDPKQIALEKTKAQGAYPQCLLCMENEGYLGRVNHPARTNHRLIRMNLDGESWGFQYSPYAYYQEHAIFLSEEHRPMVINQKTFQRLLQIVEVFPHYFVGSNADLPIVGGSILSHDHYQGGRYEFAMAKAPIETPFSLPLFQHIKAGIVKWPMSVIRLESTNSHDLAMASYYILEQWKNYSDTTLEIVAQTADGISHHTVTPIARKVGDLFQMDLVLRDNNVSKEHPDGIFHPHQEVHHIKKENIGLIEVMGLAVLPPRLKTELVEVEKFLLNQENQMAKSHELWAKKIKETYAITQDNVTEIVEQEVGLVFQQVLADAGVFKRDEAGKNGFMQFIHSL